MPPTLGRKGTKICVFGTDISAVSGVGVLSVHGAPVTATTRTGSLIGNDDSAT